MNEDAFLFSIIAGLIVLWTSVFIASLYRWRTARVPVRKRCWLLLGNTALFFVLIFFFVLSGELYYRYWYDQSDSFTLTKTGEKWFKEHYLLNSWGIRDSVEYDEKNLPGRRRVTFIGDSFTVGHGVQDVESRFCNRIRNMHPDWDVHVLSQNGADTIDQVDYIMNQLPPQYSFDTVVLVYTLNDISKIMPEWKNVIDEIYREEPSYLLEKSFLLNTLYFRWKRTRIPGVLRFYDFTLSAYEDESVWSDQQRILINLKQQIEKRGGRLLVVIFPFLHNLGKGYEFRTVHQKLGFFWKCLGVPYLDLLEAMEQYTPEELTVGTYDAHPNEFAHAVATVPINDLLSRYVQPLTSE